MNFAGFKNKYFADDTDAALRALAHEGVTKKYEVTGSSENLNLILDSLDPELAHRYMEYFGEECDLLGADENVRRAIKNKIITKRFIEDQWCDQLASPKAFAWVYSIGLLFALISAVVGFYIFTVILCLCVLCVFASYQALKGRERKIRKCEYYLEKDCLIDKTYKKGDYDRASEYWFVLEKHGKLALAAVEEDVFSSIKKGEPCYLLRINGRKRPLYIYNANKWQIDRCDFVCNNDIYTPVKK